MEGGKRIAFICPNSSPLANIKVEMELRQRIPNHEIDVIQLKPLVMRRPGVVLINSLHTMILYGHDIVIDNKRFKEAFWRTPYMFRAVKRLVAKRLSQAKYLSTFQMQSLFDCSLSHVPHFVHTD